MKGWRTLAANGLAAGLAWLNAKFGFIELSGDEQAATVITLLAVVNMILRAVTTTPVGQPE